VVHADTGTLQLLIAGALNSPSGLTQDNELTLRAGPDLPVFLVSGGAILAGPIATAAFVQWTDTKPPAGFGPDIKLVVFRFEGGLTLLAASIATPGGPVTTFSGSAPVETLTGTWTMTTGAGITGATANDAVLSLNFDTNPSNTIQVALTLVAKDMFPQAYRSVPAIPGGGAVLATRNAPLHATVAAAGDGTVTVSALPSVGPQIGVLSSYGAFFDQHPQVDSSQYTEVTALHVGDVYLLYACANIDYTDFPPCRVGATTPLGHLSGTATNQGYSGVQGATQYDLVEVFDLSHP
jgi:hypothetical protein